MWSRSASVAAITTQRDCREVGRPRKAIGEAGLEELLRASVDTSVVTNAVRPREFERIIVDTTLQEKAIAHPVDSRWLEIAGAKVVQAAKTVGRDTATNHHTTREHECFVPIFAADGAR